jgi:two-component system, NarL family, response regulator LiaR
MLHPLHTSVRTRTSRAMHIDELYEQPVGGVHPSVAQQTRILVVDDHSLFRRILREALNEHPQFCIIGEAVNGARAVALAQELNPDIVILDMTLPDMNGVAVTRQLVEALPDIRVVILSYAGNDDVIVEAIRAGAFGYLSKDIQPDALARALAGVADGEVAMSRRTAARVMARFRQVTEIESAPPPELTTREAEVLRLLAQGATDREIGDRLIIAESTAKKHVQHILRKLRARNRAEAVAKYRQFEM